MSNSAANSRQQLVLFPGQPTPRLYDCVIEALRTRHYGPRTEDAYLHWIRRFLAFRSGTHAREIPALEVNHFLIHFAVSANVAAAMQKQPLAAVLLFFTNMCWDGR